MSEQILIKTGYSSSTKTAHTKMCRAAKKAGNLREVPPDVAETMDLKDCPYCTGTHDTASYDQSYQEALKRAAKAGGD